MNVWRRGSLSDNPYRRTAFAVARVPRETSRRRSLAQLIAQTRNVIRADPHAHVLDGRPVTLEQLNAAEKTLLDPQQRMVEELLHHATERPHLEHLRKLLQRCQQALESQPTSDERAVDLRKLEGCLEHMLHLYLDAVPSPDASFGALELCLSPPFGPMED